MKCNRAYIDGILPKGPTRHAYAWKIGPFWHDTLDIGKIPAALRTGKRNAPYDETSSVWISVNNRNVVKHM